jgi:hypothetical protein
MKLTKATLKKLIKEELDNLTDDEMSDMRDSEDMEGSFRNRVFEVEDRIQDALAFIDDMRNVTLEQFVADELTAEDISEQVLTNLSKAMDKAEGLALLVNSYMKGKR